MHIDTCGLYQFSSLNTVAGKRAIENFEAPTSAKELISQASLPKSKYRQPTHSAPWKDVVFACQNPTDRSIHSVASSEDWWRFYESCCRYYGKLLFVKLHPWNHGEVETRIRTIAKKYRCEVDRGGHRLIESCDHVVLFNSTFAVDCMLLGIPVKQGAPGYFSQTGAVSYCEGNPKKSIRANPETAEKLLNFLVWRYCFSIDQTMPDWQALLKMFAYSRRVFPLDQLRSYGNYLQQKINKNTSAHAHNNTHHGRNAPPSIQNG